MNSRHDFWPQWRHLLVHAQPLYWLLQALLVLFLIGFTAVFWLPGGVQFDTLRLAARTLLDALLLVVPAHLAIRPVLRFWFVGRGVAWRHWLLLLGWLLVLSAAMFTVSYLLSEHVIRDGLNLTTVHLSSEQSSFAMELSVPVMFALGVSNAFAAYILWAIVYLAFKAFQSRRQLQAQLREARLRQLTHQLNPHFLFNAFNTIRGMIFEDRERAAQLVTQLSELFRFHLSHELRTEQTLAEEWQLAQRYLDVESVRLESRLSLQVDLDPACLERKLPSLTLLTLVENAIKHGIAPNPEGGELSVSARPTDRGWVLRVRNSTGVGRAGASNGTGLANLRERLALNHGPGASLDIDERDACFDLRLELPA